jgi:transcriptional regulator GlxA family with amidase domain
MARPNNAGKTMTLSRVEHALGMMRSYLVERATQNDWDNHGPDELAAAIAACLRRSAEESRQEAPRRDRKLSRGLLRRAIRFINDNLDSKLKWDEIAADIGLDPFSFGRGFKLSTGMTPHQYIIRCRLRRAMRLLALQELTLADVALEVGCSCQSHMTTLFRRHLGTTPGAFRASTRENRRCVPHATTTTASTIANRRTLVRQRSGVTEFRIHVQ